MHKLHYFAVPGRAEVARLCLTFGGIPFEDIHYTGQTYPEAKAKMPFGQVPVLELPDGRMLAQSGAIDRYAAKLAGLYPEDPLEAAFAAYAVFLLSELMDRSLGRWPPLHNRGLRRRAATAGRVETTASSGGYVAGGKLSFADLSIFTIACTMTSGIFDGVPKTLLSEYPALKVFRDKIASEPNVKAYYEKHGEGMRAAFKPE
ncbi:Hematopoietic prostaglandin D synthase [Tetrabaena socialis]|uniref:Hematopoietic prostaglandin D synthase n=1 Tax=Tetrabaena socialis TaxID=47790 RepID=A0A2J7ZJ05_9CHLO|nr:Hematopoietic prostaglandin D synthase [Tetrabaena socialis]|eukprot:PNH00252.1 Hematopoietic prostaglandin D synthase [Tetrabaena socialis]